MDYGCIIYGDASEKNLKILDTIQDKVFRQCLGFLQSTPVYILQAESCILLLQVRR